VIASTDKAVLKGNNRFSTGGSLSMSDIANRADYEGKAMAVSGSVSYSSGSNQGGGNASGGTSGADASGGTTSSGTATEGNGNAGDGKPKYGGGMGWGEESGHAASMTTSGISGIAGNKEVRTGDAESGIRPIFDAEKVQKEIDAQVLISQKFNEQAAKAADSYVRDKVAILKKQAEAETDPDKKAELTAEAAKWAPNGSYNIAMNIIISAAGRGSTGAISSIAKESLSWAANEMRQAMIKDSETFKGICVAGTNDCISNKSGTSVGVNGDNFKLAGGRIVLENWCAYGRCTKDSNTDSGYKENPDGTVIFNPGIDAQGNLLTISRFIEQHPVMSSPLGGHQGGQGLMDLFGIAFDYKPGSFIDELAESFAGTHDTFNSFIWYDRLGNGKEIDNSIIDVTGRVANMINVPLASPFALSVLLPPEVWNAIATVIKYGN
jgi:filamentous hemagglutinin